ncbi:MAG TPA: hypothetical protein VLZ75_15100 [Chitinophagales bacterium]|nr:hypothetical protein [Chitinophagales bacterium]
MDIMPFIIAAMLFLVQLSMYAQSTGQVTLSIKLYPIQIIEVEPTKTQTLEVLNESVNNSINQSPSPQQLSTYSTSQYTLKVESVKSAAKQAYCASSGVPPRNSRSINGIIDFECCNYETDRDHLHMVFSMETL